MTLSWNHAEHEGQTFAYLEEGEGPLVVLVHGFPDTADTWTGVLARLARAGYRGVAPALRGYRKETIVPGRPYDSATIADDVVRFLDALGADQAVLVGHDWGASAVWGAVDAAPARVRGVVPIAIPHPSVLKPTLGTVWAVRHFFSLKTPFAAQMMKRNNFAYIDTLYKRWAPNWSGTVRDQCLARFKEACADEDVLNGTIDYYRDLSLKPSGGRVPSIPGLVVGGTDDLIDQSFFPKTAQLMADGSTSLIIQGAGHWPHREGEDEFTNALLEFLASLP